MSFQRLVESNHSLPYTPSVTPPGTPRDNALVLFGTNRLHPTLALGILEVMSRAPKRQPRARNANHPNSGIAVNSPLKKPPGEGTGPTIHADFRGDPVGRVPSRGEQDVSGQAVNAAHARFHNRRRGSWEASEGHFATVSTQR